MVNNNKNKYDDVSTYADDEVSNINHTGGGNYYLSFGENFNGKDGDYDLVLNEGLNNVQLGDDNHKISLNSNWNVIQVSYLGKWGEKTTQLNINKSSDNIVKTLGDLKINQFEGNNNDIQFKNITAPLNISGNNNFLKGTNILGNIVADGDYNHIEVNNNKNLSYVTMKGNYSFFKSRLFGYITIEGDYNHIETGYGADYTDINSMSGINAIEIIGDNNDLTVADGDIVQAKGNNNIIKAENIITTYIEGNDNDIQYKSALEFSCTGVMNKINLESSANLSIGGNKNSVQFGNLNGNEEGVDGCLAVSGENNIVKGGNLSSGIELSGSHNNIQVENLSNYLHIEGEENFTKVGTFYGETDVRGTNNTFQFDKIVYGSDGIGGLYVHSDENTTVKGGDIKGYLNVVYSNNLHLQVGNVSDDIDIFVERGNNTIQFGDGKGKINASGDKNVIIGGNGDLQISANGSDQFIKLGNGKHTITDIIGNSRIITGNDDDSISFSGSGNVINAGNGNNKIFSDYQASNAQIITGNGNDEIHIVGSNNVITSGKGHDQIFGDFGSFDNIGHNKYILDQAFTSISTYTEINNFDAKQGDVLDLKKSLANTTFGSTAKDFTSLKNYVSVTSQGSDVNIGISQYGDNQFTTLAILHNQNVPVTLDSLVTQGAISYS